MGRPQKVPIPAWSRLPRKTVIANCSNYWFGFDFHSKQSSQPELGVRSEG